MTVERVRVGEVLTLKRREVSVEPTSEYTLIGIYSFGKGIFHREPRPGSELGDYRFFAIQPGDLVLSNIQAWEGAIGVAKDLDSGTIGTHRFLSYVPIDTRIDTNWAHWFFLSERGMALIRQAAPGSTIRNRTLAIDRFEALEIPLPPIDEQRRVADRLDLLRTRATELRIRSDGASTLGDALTDAAVAHTIEQGVGSGWPVLPLSSVAEINPKPDRLDPDQPVTFVPMAAVDARTGSIASPEDRLAADVGPGFKQFRTGDVLFARITPCMQNGKAAVFRQPTKYGYGSTEFHVVRPGPDLTADWLHRLMRTTEFRKKAAERFTGTAGQQRVPADFLRTVEIPVPSVDQQVQATQAIDRLTETSLTLKGTRRSSDALLSAIVPAALNEAFADLS